MDIIKLGHSSFKISGRMGKVVTDPFDPEMVGIKFPKVEADIVTVSHAHKDHNQTGLVGGNPLVISGPGEYEIKGIKIIGLSTYHDNQKGLDRGPNTVYRIEVDGVYVVHCGDLGHKFTDHDIDLLDKVDILLIPVGGHFSLDPHQASEIVSQIDPSIIIPMHYNTAGLNQKNFSMLLPVENFLKEVGKDDVKSVPKLTVSKDKLPVEPMVVVLE